MDGIGVFLVIIFLCCLADSDSYASAPALPRYEPERFDWDDWSKQLQADLDRAHSELDERYTECDRSFHND